MNLKYLRKEFNKTQKDIAELLKTKTNNYTRYELEQVEPSINTLKILADYYNVSLDFLVGREYNNNIGYLTEEQRSTIKLITKLNELNLMKANSYISGLLANQ